MRPQCVICTDVFCINSHISVSPCGHAFHEECLFRWRKTGQKNCPQCRASTKESAIIKRLYLTEPDLSSTQVSSATSGVSLEENENVSEAIKKQHKNLLFLCEDLKNDIRTKKQSVDEKAKQLQQANVKINLLEESKEKISNKLNESNILVDCLKKQFDNYENLKKQCDQRDKKINALDSQLRGYKSIDIIYKSQEEEFANEMRKYVHTSSNLDRAQSAIKQLVQTNVFLKTQLDKQTEEKRSLRKKMLYMERYYQTEREKEKEKALSAIKKQNDFDELQDKAKSLERRLEEKCNELSIFSQLSSEQKPSEKEVVVELKKSKSGLRLADLLENTPVAAQQQSRGASAVKNISISTSCNLTPTSNGLLSQFIEASCNRVITLDDEDEYSCMRGGQSASSMKETTITSKTDASNLKRKNPFKKYESEPFSKKLTNDLQSGDISSSEDNTYDFNPSPFKKHGGHSSLASSTSDFNFSRFISDNNNKKQKKQQPSDVIDIAQPINSKPATTIIKSKNLTSSSLNVTAITAQRLMSDNSSLKKSTASPISIIKPVASSRVTSTFVSDGLGGRKKIYKKTETSSRSGV